MTDNPPVDMIHSREHDGGPNLELPSDLDQPPQSAPLDAESKYEQDVPPDGGYGWVCVACVFWINAHTWGINSSYGVFLSYYLSHDVFPNTSDLSYAFTGGLSISCALLVAPVATYLIHVFGTRFTLNLGVFFETLSLIGSSFATQRWHIFLSQGVCFGWGMGFLFVGTVGIIPQWFSRRRSLAMGINAAGSGLGGLMYSLAVGAIIPRLGLAWAFRILGIIACVVNLVCANLLRDRNQAVGSRHQPFALPLLKRPEFLLFLGWGVFSMLGYVALLFSVANFALSVGLTSHQGSVVSALLNLGQGLGRPFVGMFSDRLGRINIATFLTFLCGLFCLVIWTFARSMGVVCFFAVLVGTVAGTYWATVAPVASEIIGLRDLPSGLSITWLVLVAPCTVSEPVALLLRDNHARDAVYLRVQIFTGFMYIGAALCLWVVRGWKIAELAHAAAAEHTPGGSSPATGVKGAAKASKIEDTAAGPEAQPAPHRAPKWSLWSSFSLLRRMVSLQRV
ncbi:MCT family MFS transporter [Aspergillus saccharolyticus JOP 1030-1]|uniref:Monocarboxylate transporter n=1 Tax=Aspergillus saccharolyticus JOP 1030-1 TaxID=1450539 RepID=A0A318Z6Q1_9EURO|nr:monocarboxylate transporter [Aspergillus saccharolyticus JOP 1030-1]PYH42114.1 monocarboxylate transporter [Aspergillus saccharolyticus JOP 1030-1]